MIKRKERERERERERSACYSLSKPISEKSNQIMSFLDIRGHLADDADADFGSGRRFGSRDSEMMYHVDKNPAAEPYFKRRWLERPTHAERSHSVGRRHQNSEYASMMRHCEGRYFMRKRAACTIQKSWRIHKAAEEKRETDIRRSRSSISSVRVGRVLINNVSAPLARKTALPTTSVWKRLTSTWRRRESPTSLIDAGSFTDSDSSSTTSSPRTVLSDGSAASTSLRRPPRILTRCVSEEARPRLPVHDAVQLHGRSEVMEHNCALGIEISHKVKGLVSPTTATNLVRPYFLNDTSPMTKSPIKRFMRSRSLDDNLL